MGHGGLGQRAVGAVTRRVVALLISVVTAWVLAGDATGPFVSSGAPLSASAMRAALDGRSEAFAALREQVIDLRRTQIAIRDKVVEMEEIVAAGRSVGGEAAPLEESADDDPWTEAGIVTGQVADAEALNEVFARFGGNVTNVRAFQALLILDQDVLFGRVEAIEAAAGIVDPPPAGSLVPNEAEVSVPHVFTTGTLMRSSELNANLMAVDAGLIAEAAMASAIAARQAVLAERVEVLWEDLGPRTAFSWRIGTLHSTSGLDVDTHFMFESPEDFEPFTINVTGLEAYERSTTVNSATIASTGWIESSLPSGVYTATTTYGGTDFSIPIAFDATRVLALPVLALGAVSTSEVAFAIERVEGAFAYRVTLQQVGGPIVRWFTIDAFEEPAHGVTLGNLDLDPSVSYHISVSAMNVFNPWSPYLFPQQVDRSFQTTGAFSPGVGD